MKIKNKQIVILLCVVVVVGLLVCGGSLVLGGAEVIDLRLSVLIARLAAIIALVGMIPVAIWVSGGIVRAISRHVHRLHH